MTIPTRTLLALLLILSGTPAPVADEAADTGAKVFVVDPEGSEVTFLMETTWHEVHGKTHAITGTVESMGGGVFEDAVAKVVVDATTLDTGNKRRDKTMHNEYMMTSQWPRITFRSTAAPVRIDKDPNAPAGAISFELAGDLTIRSETRGVLLSLTARPEGEGWVVTGEHTVSLLDYGIPDPSMILNKVQDAVKVTFSVRVRPE